MAAIAISTPIVARAPVVARRARVTARAAVAPRREARRLHRRSHHDVRLPCRVPHHAGRLRPQGPRLVSTRYPIKSFHGALWYLPVWVESLARRVTPRPPASAAVLFRDSSKTGGFETPQKCTAKRGEIDSQTLTDPPTRPPRSNAAASRRPPPAKPRRCSASRSPRTSPCPSSSSRAAPSAPPSGSPRSRRACSASPGFKFWRVDDRPHHLHVLPLRCARDEAHRRLPQGVLEELRYPLRVHLRWYGDDQLRARRTSTTPRASCSSRRRSFP